MPETAPTVLLTRPKAQSQRFAAELGYPHIVISPIIKVESRDFSVDPKLFDRLIFTSENGVRFAAARCELRGMKGYAVGHRTADVGAEFGIDLCAAGGTADHLVELISQDRPAGRLLHLRGEHSRGAIEERLKNVGIETVSAIVYDQTPQPLTRAAMQVLGRSGSVILPIFSPRTAALLAPMVRDARAALAVIGISEAVLDAWAGPEPAEKIALSEPSGAAMLAEIRRQIGGAA